MPGDLSAALEAAWERAATPGVVAVVDLYCASPFCCAREITVVVKLVDGDLPVPDAVCPLCQGPAIVGGALTRTEAVEAGGAP